MKTLADILKECREEAQKTVDVIDKLIAESKEAGVTWPELENVIEIKGQKYNEIKTNGGCIGCAFAEISCSTFKRPPCTPAGGRIDNSYIIFQLIEPEVTTFNDVE